MRKLIVLFAVSLIFSCKKEKPVEPTPPPPVVVTPPVYLTGDCVFYIKTHSGTLSVVVDSTGIGSTTMIPQGWAPDCHTVGWCLKFSGKEDNYSYKATITPSKGSAFVKTGNFHLVGGGCLSIGI